MIDDLKPEYLTQEEAAGYLRCRPRMIALYRKHGLLRSAKLGRNFVYRVDWLNCFMETWSGYDMSSEDKIRLAVNSRAWRNKHGE